MSSLKVLEIKRRSDVLNYEGADAVFIKTKPTKKLIALLLDIYPDLKQILISRKMVKYMKKYIPVLKNMGIRVIIKELKRGRKPYPDELKKRVIKYALKHGIEKASKKFKIARRTIFYWKSNSSFRNP